MNILLATDGRQPARDAAELLVRLVDPAHVEVTVVHAREYGNEVFAETYAADVLAEAKTTFDGAGIASHPLYVDAPATVAIAKAVADGGSELLVLGAGNHTWLGGLVFGSVSTHVLHTALTPVLLVHRAPRPEHDRIKVLIGADGSPAAIHAINTLVGLTEPGRIEAEVRSVVELPEPALDWADPGGGGVMLATYVKNLFQQAEELATRNLDVTLERLRSEGFRPNGSLGEGWAGNDLLDHAERGEADVVVVGARRIGVLDRLTMGSVSSHVVRHAPATLMTHATAPHDEKGTWRGLTTT